ncbi:MAG: tetratricopeptide repeat protein [Candidatus Omnitrophica bacterium]|nr:tetratricopeptide repeat protein [Candidatus Omnitrophota bacterium]
MKRPFLFSLILLFVAVNVCAQAYPLRQKFEEAFQAYTQNNLGKARTMFEEVTKNAPDFAPGYNYLGLVLKEQGDNVLAVQMFERAMYKDPKYFESYENLGKYYYSIGQFDKAIEYCKKAIEINPAAVNSKLTLGWVYLLGKEDPWTAIDYLKAVVDETNAKYALFGLGMAYYMSNQSFRTLEMITKLKSMGDDQFASELEAMIRKGPYNKNSGSSTAIAGAVDQSANDKKQPATKDASRGSAKSYKVRLRAPYEIKSKTVEQEVVNPTDSSNGDDRIKALQEQGRNIPEQQP